MQDARDVGVERSYRPPSDLRLSDRVVVKRLLDRARRQPDRPAYYSKQAGRWVPMTWGRLVDDVLSFARGLIELGLPKKGYITVLSFNRIEWIISLLGAQAADGICGGIYDTCSPEEVAYLNRHCDATFVVVENRPQWDKVKARWKAGDAPKAVIVMDPEGVPLGEDSGLRTLAFETVLDMGRRASAEALDDRLRGLDPEATASLIYTSGTTGFPKGVQLSHRNIVFSTRLAYEALDGTEDFIVLSYLPLSHVAEQLISVYGPVIFGYTAYFAESREAVPENLKEVRPLFFLGVPRAWEKFCAKIQAEIDKASGLRAAILAFARAAATRAGPYLRSDQPLPPTVRLRYELGRLAVFDRLKRKLGFDRCRIYATGAAPISPQILEFFQSLDMMIREVYGMTEVSGLSSANQTGRIRFGTVGEPLEGLVTKIAEDGEILIKGESVFGGYLHDEAATREALTEDGWLRTGDVGRLDDDGFLTITDRKKEILITSGGKNVSPQMIEGMLKNLPLVSQAAVVGDGQKYVAALLTLDREAAHLFLESQGKEPENAAFESLAADRTIRDEVARGVEQVNLSLARVEQIKRFRILPNEFSHDTGELTPTLKLKRRVIEEKYAEAIESLFAS